MRRSPTLLLPVLLLPALLLAGCSQLPGVGVKRYVAASGAMEPTLRAGQSFRAGGVE